MLNVVLAVGGTALLTAAAIDLFGVGSRGGTLTTNAVPLIDESSGDEALSIDVAAAARSGVPSRKLTCAPTRLMLLGDTTTAVKESYRGPLYRSLISRGIPVDFVGSQREVPIGGGDDGHEGRPGYTIGPDDRKDASGVSINIFDNVDGWLTRSAPNVVVVSAGQADLAPGSTEGANAADRYAGLIDKMLNTKPELIIITTDVGPTPAFPVESAEQTAVNETARQIGNASETDSLIYANAAERMAALGFDPATDIQKDQTHVTVTGGRKWAAALESTVAEAIVEDRRRRCVQASPDASIPAEPGDGVIVEETPDGPNVTVDGVIVEDEEFIQ
jgi:hypothetical protein